MLSCPQALWTAALVHNDAPLKRSLKENVKQAMRGVVKPQEDQSAYDRRIALQKIKVQFQPLNHALN